jgi:hypothetical protein
VFLGRNAFLIVTFMLFLETLSFRGRNLSNFIKMKDYASKQLSELFKMVERTLFEQTLLQENQFKGALSDFKITNF